MTRFRALLLGLFVVASVSSSADPFKIAFQAKGGKVVEHTIDDDALADVIVEFRDTPLLMRPAAPNAQAIRSFETRFQQFSRDLERIGNELALASQSSAEPRRDNTPRIRRTFSRVFAGASVRAPQQAIAAIEHLPYVAAVHDDSRVEAFGAGRTRATARTRRVRASSGGQGIVVAVIDTGIDYHHPALGGGLGPAFKVIGGWDFANDDADPLDDHGHGTHVSGIIAGDSEEVAGVAPQASLLAYKVLDAGGSGLESTIIAAVERAVDPNQDGDPSDHADIVNMSLGGRGAEDSPLTQAVENATATGMVFCIAAGNAFDFFTIGSPGNAPSAITVGAADGDDVIAPFSSKGPLPDSMSLKPDLVAPGVNISSAKLGGGVIAFSGTSMATPHVAGVAALLLAEHPEWLPAAIKSAIVNTAHVLGNEVMIEGAGRIDATRAGSADVLASPQVISFGNSGAATETWSSTREVTLSNRSTAAMTLDASTTGTGTGIEVTCTPPSFTLEPGQSLVVTIRLTVTHAAVPWPEEGSLSFGGNILFQGSTTPIHIPWAFGKAALLQVAYDGPLMRDGLSLVVSGKNRIHFKFGNTIPTLPLAAGTVDIVAVAHPPAQDRRVIVLERQQLAGSTRIDLAPGNAPFTVRLDAKDENGNLLDSPSRLCDETHSMAFPWDTALGWVSVVQSSTTPYYTSALSSRITLSTVDYCREKSLPKYYLAQFPVLRGLEGPVTQTLPASAWVRQPVRMLAPPLTSSPGFKPVVQATLTGYGGFLIETYPSSPRAMDSEQWTGTFLFNAEAGGSITHHFRPELWADTPSGSPSTAISSPTLRIVDGQVVPMFGWWLPSPADYRVPAESTLTLGDAPIHPDGVIGASENALTAVVQWMGPVGEQRPIDHWTSTSTVYDSSGAVIRSGPLSGSLPGPGVYRVQTTSANAVAGAQRGTATYTGTFDTRNGSTTLPLIRALRILDANGVQTSRLPRGSAAALLFAIDLSQLSEPRTGSEAVRVEYRAHGASEWRALAPVLIAEEYEPGFGRPAGSVFQADLAAVTAAIEGTVDLRLSVQSPGTNRIEYVVEPAFAAGELSRHRAARH